MQLSKAEVHLWYVEPERVRDRQLLEGCDQVLSAAERARMARFRREQDRHLYLVGHAAVRCVLSQYAPVPPGDWSFASGPKGKPLLASPGGAPPLAFNLSHTHSLVAVAVAAAGEVGVDVECIHRPLAESLVERVLAESERACLDTLEPRCRAAAFFEFWTLKEAYLKARGDGLVWPLDRIAFEWAPDRSARLRRGLDGEDPAAWRFWRAAYDGNHRVAVAARSPHTMSLRVFSADLAAATAASYTPSTEDTAFDRSTTDYCDAGAARPPAEAGANAVRLHPVRPLPARDLQGGHDARG